MLPMQLHLRCLEIYVCAPRLCRRPLLKVQCVRKNASHSKPTKNPSRQTKREKTDLTVFDTPAIDYEVPKAEAQKSATKSTKDKRRAKGEASGNAKSSTTVATTTSGGDAAKTQQKQTPKHVCGYVALVGRPNAGKSTLTNTLLGQKLSIVTKKPQTTRHRVLGILSEEDYQIILLDTPGVVEDMRNKLEERMMKNIRRAMDDADAVLLVIDATQQIEDYVPVLPATGYEGPPVCVVLNKMDQLDGPTQERLLKLYQRESHAHAVVLASAAKGNGVESIKGWLVSKMPKGPALYDKDVVSEFPERFFISEIVREHIFRQYQEEIPYCVAVQCLDYKERNGAKDFAEVAIYVEKDRQKAILLGKGGSAIKQLSTAARADIEDFLGRPVYLNTSVKVKEKWRKDDALLEQLGY